MATLTGQSIASSYEQLLHVDTDGGGNTTTLVPIKDGDNGTTFCLQLSTTKAMIEGSGSKLFFSDEGGEYISGDSTDLTLTSGSDIHLTAANDVNIPVNVGLRFGDGGENIETDNTSLTITAATASALVLDANSRISLSNNDVSSSTNTIFGKLAFNTVDSNELNNVVIGEQAGELVNADQNDNNVYIGYQAATGGTGGRTDNVAIGYRAWGSDGSTNTTGGNENVFIGSGSGNGTWTSGGCDSNTAVGYGTLAGAMNGAGANTAIGRDSLAAVTTGSNNCGLGEDSGDVITTGSQNTIIGSDSDPLANNGANQTVIGYGATGVADNSVTLGNASVTDVYMAQDKGAVIHGSAIRTAGQVHTGTTGIGTLTLDGLSRGDGGFIEFVLVIVGTIAVDDTMVFTYAKTGYAAWNLVIELMSTDGFGTFKVGGYNNTSATGFTIYEEDTNGMATLTATNSGQDNVITLTMNDAQVHPTFKFKYTQGGADGAPTLDDVSIVFSIA